MPLRIAMVAPPWVEVPPSGYGGVEASIAALVEELLKQGHEVELFTVETSRADVTAKHWLYKQRQYEHISRPLYDIVAIPLGHVLHALREILPDRGFHVIHDHNYLLGPALLSAGSPFLPVVHTLHGPFFKEQPGGPASNLEVYELLADYPGLWFVAISRAQASAAPERLQRRILGVVHHGLKVNQVEMGSRSRGSFITMARFAPEKGHHIAAKLCAASGKRLLLAGSVGPLRTPAAVMAAIDDKKSPHWHNSELQYFAAEVLSQLIPGTVDYVGEVQGQRKLQLLQSARALLLPIRWDEPFGMAALEAMACGTPVIAFARGALTEVVLDGLTGFLVDDEAAFAAALDRVDHINPADCRRAVMERFSATVMAERYLTIYREAINRHRYGRGNGDNEGQ